MNVTYMFRATNRQARGLPELDGPPLVAPTLDAPPPLGVTPDRDAFERMGYRERLALKREDPAGYAALRHAPGNDR